MTSSWWPAIEPAIGAHDRLDLAANSPGSGGRIGPQQTRTWWVEWWVGE
jgi:hypothetical protein